MEAILEAKNRAQAGDELMRLQTLHIAMAAAFDGRNKSAFEKYAKRLAAIIDGKEAQ